MEIDLVPQDGARVGRKDSDYIAGVLPYFVRVLDGNWTPWIPQGEKQYNKAADSMSCVSFAETSSIETQEKFLTGFAPNYSDRWVAKVSGTTREGNYLWKVADTIKEYGLVWEEHYPQPIAPWTFDEWMSDIPPELLARLKQKGQEWKWWWTIQYEWVNLHTNPTENILKALRQCPVIMIIPGHAVEAIYKPADLVTYLDTYEPYIKGRPLSDFVDALKVILIPLRGQIMTNAVLVKRGTGVGAGYGWYLEDINPSALISNGLHFGMEIPKNPDGSVNFAETDKLVKGQVTTW